MPGPCSVLERLRVAITFIDYVVIHTMQTELEFGRMYAAYGAVFIVLALVWGRLVDDWRPDRFDLIGAAVVLVGVFILLWGRRWF
jgi:small multidrug resistance family-3 protein